MAAIVAGVMAGARWRTAAASAAGTTPIDDQDSTARTSISSQVRSLVSSLNSSAISGSE